MRILFVGAEAARANAEQATADAKAAEELAERERIEAEEAEAAAAAAAANEERAKRLDSEATVPMRRKNPAYAGDNEVIEALPDEVANWEACGWTRVA